MNNNIKPKDEELCNECSVLQQTSEMLDMAYDLINKNDIDWGEKTIYENRDQKQRALQNLNETSKMLAEAFGVDHV